MKKPILTFDMDSITVDMMPSWVKKYNDATGESIVCDNIATWGWADQTKNPELCNEIIEYDGFFEHLPAISGAIECINKLRDKAHVVFLTQPPRKSNFAVRDKKRWIANNFPDFDMQDIIFAHRKYMIFSDLLFDDNADHLKRWKEFVSPYKDCIAATISYKYNLDYKADWRFEKETAWTEFYNKVCHYYNL